VGEEIQNEASTEGWGVAGTALQQSIFIAIDEQTGFLSEIRTVANVSPNLQNVMQTQFNNWTQRRETKVSWANHPARKRKSGLELPNPAI
jgi:hypothetical protein